MKEGISKIINSKSKTFLVFCFCFIFGAGLWSAGEWEKFWLFRLYLFLFVIGFCLIIFWHKKYWRFTLLCLAFFVIGAIRFLLTVPSATPDEISFYNGERREIVGVISEEPDARPDATRYIVETMSLRGPRINAGDEAISQGNGVVASPLTFPASCNDKKVSGKILVKLPSYPEYQYGDELTIQCVLQAPKIFYDSNFRYDEYLARQGIFSVCANPVILALPTDPSATPQDDNMIVRVKKIMLSFKSKVAEKIAALWPEPESSLMAGLLYGARGGFDQNTLDAFSRVGITHIIAISGYNISIVAAVLMTALIAAGLYRRQAFWLCVAGVILFVLFTGTSASVVRAGIMGIIVLLAGQLGRLSRVGNALVFTAALMLLVNPYVLIWDAGFQLSFTATLGLVYLAPILMPVILNATKNLSVKFGAPQILPRWLAGQHDSLNWFFEILVSTFAAITATLPLILYQFGRLSLVAPLANLLVLWIIPWLMFFGFLAASAGFVFFPVAQVIAYVAYAGLKYVIIVAQWLARVPGAAVEFSLPVWAMLALYLILFLFVRRSYGEKNKNPTFG